MDERELIFENLKRVADSTVKNFGNNCEVALHDFSDFQKSLIYIAGNVTKRSIGAPITDLVLKELKEHGNDIEDKHNYRTGTNTGLVIKSSTTYIRNSEGCVIGAYCVNYNMTDFMNTISIMDNFVGVQKKTDVDTRETFAQSATETIEAILEKGISHIGRQPVTMNLDDKIKLIEIMDNNGAFMLKGSVEHMAKVMGVTKFTIYNYLKKIRGNKDR